MSRIRLAHDRHVQHAPGAMMFTSCSHHVHIKRSETSHVELVQQVSTSPKSIECVRSNELNQVKPNELNGPFRE